MKTLACMATISVLALMPQASQPLATVDHIILGINDLETGIAEFERKTGVRPVFGGVHPNRGTQNALASLGDNTYIEVLAPDPKQQNPTDAIQGLPALTSLTPVGWALGVREVLPLQARLQQREIVHTAAMPGSRALPDGSRLEWTTFGVTRPAHDWMPFFIAWKDPAHQPARTSPRGCLLVSLQLRDPSPGPLTAVLSAVGLDIALLTGDSKMTVTLECPKGRVTF